MEPADLVYVVLPILLLFAAGVTLLLVFWPRPPPPLLDRTKKEVEILDVLELSHDTKRFRLSLGAKGVALGLPVGKHMAIYAPNPESSRKKGTWNGRDDKESKEEEISRKYTPITGNEAVGYVDLVIKIYRAGKVKMPDGTEVQWDDGGKLGLYLDSKKAGDTIQVNGPFGVNEYLGRGTFKLPGRTHTVSKVGMMAGGTGLTPMLQVVQAALRDPGDTCKFTLIYANKTEDDILCRQLLEDAERQSGGRFKVHYTLDFPPEGWPHKTGFITQNMIKECLPPPGLDTLVFMCGPPGMVEHACKKNLTAMGYDKQLMVAF